MVILCREKRELWILQYSYYFSIYLIIEIKRSKETSACASSMSNKNKQGLSNNASNKEKESQKKTNTRPKPVFFWTNADVLKWLRRHCEEYHTVYASLFLEHDITGRTLVRLNDTTLEKMGIDDKTHRDELCREILKLKLKSDILEMKDLERKGEHL